MLPADRAVAADPWRNQGMLADHDDQALQQQLAQSRERLRRLETQTDALQDRLGTRATQPARHQGGDDFGVHRAGSRPASARRSPDDTVVFGRLAQLPATNVPDIDRQAGNGLTDEFVLVNPSATSFPSVISGTSFDPPGQFFAIVELGLVKPYATSGDAPTIASANQATAAAGLGINAGFAPAAYTAGLAASSELATPSNLNYQLSPRVTIGYKIPDGMGIRARYFMFDHTVSLTDAAANTLNQRLRMQTQDIETFGTERVGRNSGTMFGGFRYADFTAASAVFNAGGSFTAQQIASGAGVTAGVTGTSILGQAGNLSVCSGVRGSVLFGNLSANVLDNGTSAVPVQISRPTNAFSIWEVSLGSQYRRQLANGANFLIGSSIETQWWNNGGSLNPWVMVSTTSADARAAATNGVVGTPGSFGTLGFWNSLGLSY